LGLSFVRHLLERSEGNKRYDSRRREIIATPYVTVPTPPCVLLLTTHHPTTIKVNTLSCRTINANFTKFPKVKELRIRRPTTPIICISYNFTKGYSVVHLVEALRYKPEGREINT
jgi:hypothetical protein